MWVAWDVAAAPDIVVVGASVTITPLDAVETNWVMSGQLIDDIEESGVIDANAADMAAASELDDVPEVEDLEVAEPDGVDPDDEDELVVESGFDVPEGPDWLVPLV